MDYSYENTTTDCAQNTERFARPDPEKEVDIRRQYDRKEHVDWPEEGSEIPSSRLLITHVGDNYGQELRY